MGDRRSYLIFLWGDQKSDLIGADLKISHFLVGITFLGKVVMAVWLGIKSWFWHRCLHFGPVISFLIILIELLCLFLNDSYLKKCKINLCSLEKFKQCGSGWSGK